MLKMLPVGLNAPGCIVPVWENFRVIFGFSGDNYFTYCEGVGEALGWKTWTIVFG